jgi:hypothetical protein
LSFCRLHRNKYETKQFDKLLFLILNVKCNLLVEIKWCGSCEKVSSRLTFDGLSSPIQMNPPSGGNSKTNIKFQNSTNANITLANFAIHFHFPSPSFKKVKLRNKMNFLNLIYVYLALSK